MQRRNRKVAALHLGQELGTWGQWVARGLLILAIYSCYLFPKEMLSYLGVAVMLGMQIALATISTPFSAYRLRKRK